MAWVVGYVIYKWLTEERLPREPPHYQNFEKPEEHPKEEEEEEKKSEGNSSDDEDPYKEYDPIEKPNISMSKSMSYSSCRSFAISKQKFETCFDDSVFMKYYSKVGTRTPPLKECIEGLCMALPKLKTIIENLVKMSDPDEDKIIVNLWVGSTEITKPINLSLMMDAYYTFDLKEIDIDYIKSQLKKLGVDYEHVIKHSIKFIRRLNTLIVDVCTYKNSEERIVYRGVNAKLFPNVKVGEEFRIVNFM